MEDSRALRWVPLDARVAAQLGAAVAVSTAIGLALALTGGWKVPAALLAMTALLMLGTLRPALFVGLFILVRPLVNAISSKQLAHGVASANANGLTALLLIAVLLVLAATRPVHGPRGTLAFGWVLVTSAFAAVYAFATLGGTVGGDPISEFLRLTSLLAMYVLAANLFGTVDRARLMFRLVALSGVVPAIVGLVQWIQGPPFIPELGLARITSTLGGSPNTFAAYLAVCALLLIAAPMGLPRWVRLPSLALVVTTLVGTYSREGWGMLLIGFVLIGWKHRRRLVLTVAAVTTIVVLAVPGVHHRVLPTEAKSTATSPAGGTTASLDWRLQNWRHLLERYSHSKVIGFGLGSEPYVHGLPDPSLPPGQDFPAHNSLVQILIEGGVVLLIPWLALLAALLRSSARMARAAWELSPLARVVLALWISVVVGGLVFEDLLDTTTVVLIVLAVTGSLDGAWRTVRSRARPGEAS